MEKRILKKLSFDLTFPTRYQFLKQFAHSARLTQKQVTLAIYLSLLSHIDYNLNYIAASKVAAAVIHYVLQVNLCHHHDTPLLFTNPLAMSISVSLCVSLPSHRLTTKCGTSISPQQPAALS
jgi:hypothetical protein